MGERVSVCVCECVCVLSAVRDGREREIRKRLCMWLCACVRECGERELRGGIAENCDSLCELLFCSVGLWQLLVRVAIVRV